MLFLDHRFQPFLSSSLRSSKPTRKDISKKEASLNSSRDLDVVNS